MRSTDLEVSPDDLRQIQDVLDGAGRALFARAADLDQTPDAGASSDEVGRALADLSGAVAGLATHLGSLAANAGHTGSDFAGTDASVSGGMRQRRGVLGP